ncbi:MAG TPA: histone deacetylase [Chloroflexota bacterium]|nr:histone deacetylase [Chloroflexota bacterium]
MKQVLLFLHPECLAHETGRHPENPRRLEAIWEALQRASLPRGVSWAQPAPATLEQVLRVHRPELVNFIRELAARGGGPVDADTVTSARSFDAALIAAGGAIEAVGHVLSQPGRRAFALVRPPGHHATPERAMGFCLFNNVAIAVQAALVEQGLKRVAIVDFDVHHGNGTQAAFAAEPRVLFCSLHQFPWYPGSGRAEEIGEGAARGQTVNLPLPAGCGDAVYQAAFERVVVPVVRRFQPELIVASAGFDAHWADPLAEMAVSTTGFVTMVRTLASLADELCQGRLALSLEGGYDRQALASSVVAVTTVLAGGEPEDLLGPAPGGELKNVDLLLDEVCRLHQI